MPMIRHGVDMTIECQRMSEDLDFIFRSEA